MRITLASLIALMAILIGIAGWSFNNGFSSSVQATTGVQSQIQSTDRKLVSEQSFIALLTRNPRLIAATLAEADANWDISYLPMFLEASQFMPQVQRASRKHSPYPLMLSNTRH